MAETSQAKMVQYFSPSVRSSKNLFRRGSHASRGVPAAAASMMTPCRSEARRAAATPLPETSATVARYPPSGRGMTSKKSPPTW